MPEGIAIATTKRKFYKALDSFTTSSQVSLAPSATEPTTSKRPATATAAFDEARERAKKRLRHSTSSSSLPPAVIPAPTPTKKIDGKSQKPPNFSPWSHEAFLARLKTFSSVSLWHPKPEAISEVEWAKRGWICVDVNTVACKGGCERRVVVSLGTPKRKVTQEEVESEDDDEDAEAAIEQALAERYKDVIIEGHGANCLWRKDGCKDDIYRLQIVRPSIWQPELRKRYQSALAINDSIQNVKMKTVNKDDPKTVPTQRLLQELPRDLVENPSAPDDSTPSEPALEVAMHGWRGSSESSSELLNCDACFQRIGLWMYQPDYRPHAPSSSNPEEENDDNAVIELVEMHREHCPWRNAASQQASGSLKGLNACQIMQRVVATYARDQRRRSDEHTHGEDADGGGKVEAAVTDTPRLSRQEILQQDKERESRLRKLKAMFTIKRRSKSVPKAGPA
jgi:hypothetical protein